MAFTEIMFNNLTTRDARDVKAKETVLIFSEENLDNLVQLITAVQNVTKGGINA